ncbi:MAG: hypothetical protein ACYSSP_00470 [Planctomycetota bacterium]|jgi:hypothetical protein
MEKESKEHIDKEQLMLSEPKPVCPNCFQPCDKLQDYCSHCGSNEPINPLASYIPFVNIRFNTGMYHKIWRKTFSRAVPLTHKVIFILLLFIGAPILLFVGYPLVLIEKVQNVKVKNNLRFIFWAVLLSVVIIFVGYQIYSILRPSYWRY